MTLRPNRRTFLHTAASAACGLAAADPWQHALANAPREPRIDAHTHFYDPRRPGGIPWPSKGDTVLYRPVLPDDLWRVAPRLTGTVVVEASPRLEDNQWILDLAETDQHTDQRIVGCVGHLTPGTPEFASHLTRFAANRLFRGIRI
jgi:predicted TIM-barrel fold metal-dependent hydrolase